jgi:hypothetical protein
VAQLALSVFILWVLLSDIDTDAIKAVLISGSIWWAAAALGIKTLALIVHEWRLWLALPQPRPPLRAVISLGLAAGALNLALPARAGDLAAIAFMDRECDVPVPVGTAAVGVTSFLEAAIFAFFLLAVMGLGAAQWASLVGDSSTAAWWIAGGIATGCGILGAMAIVGRRWATDETHPNRFIELIKRTVVETSSSVRDARYLGTQTAAAAFQVVLVVSAFTLALLACGASVSNPIAAASMVLGIASLASFVLPPTMAAGPAASSALVLPAFGASPSEALAYAAGYWLVAHIPAMTMGIPALFARR